MADNDFAFCLPDLSELFTLLLLLLPSLLSEPVVLGSHYWLRTSNSRNLPGFQHQVGSIEVPNLKTEQPLGS